MFPPSNMTVVNRDASIAKPVCHVSNRGGEPRPFLIARARRDHAGSRRQADRNHPRDRQRPVLLANPARALQAERQRRCVAPRSGAPGPASAPWPIASNTSTTRGSPDSAADCDHHAGPSDRRDRRDRSRLLPSLLRPPPLTNSGSRPGARSHPGRVSHGRTSLRLRPTEHRRLRRAAIRCPASQARATPHARTITPKLSRSSFAEHGLTLGSQARRQRSGESQPQQSGDPATTISWSNDTHDHVDDSSKRTQH